MLEGIKLADGAQPKGAPPKGERVTPDTSNLKPLTEMGDAKYHGFSGGLYGDGKNQRPKAHEAAGLASPSRSSRSTPTANRRRPARSCCSRSA